jgi:hypothetical protein
MPELAAAAAPKIVPKTKAIINPTAVKRIDWKA